MDATAESLYTLYKTAEQLVKQLGRRRMRKNEFWGVFGKQQTLEIWLWLNATFIHVKWCQNYNKQPMACEAQLAAQLYKQDNLQCVWTQ